MSSPTDSCYDGKWYAAWMKLNFSTLPQSTDSNGRSAYARSFDNNVILLKSGGVEYLADAGYWLHWRPPTFRSDASNDNGADSPQWDHHPLVDVFALHAGVPHTDLRWDRTSMRTETVYI